MKIAIATENDQVAQHFGRCAAYTLVEFKDNRVLGREIIANPGHQPGFLPRFLAERGVSCIIAGGMGRRAQDLFAAQNIETIIGVTGPVDRAIAGYLSGDLPRGESLCDHLQQPGGHHCSGEQ